MSDNVDIGLYFMFAAILNLAGPFIITEEYLVDLDLEGKEIVMEQDMQTMSWVISLRKEEDVRDTSDLDSPDS